MPVTWTTQRSGNWSLPSDNASSPWYDAGTQTGRARTPGSSGNANNDLVVIANGHTLTCDASVTIGDATAPSNLAVSTAGTGGTGVLSVSSGVTLTVVSNVRQGNATWTFQAGSGLTFNSGTALTWQIGDAHGQAGAQLNLSGTPGSRITVRSVGAANGSFTTGGFTRAGKTISTCVDFVRIGVASTGTGTQAAWTFYPNGTGADNFVWTSCTWDASCGRIETGAVLTAQCIFKIEDCVFDSTGQNLSASLGGSALTTGTRSIQRNYFAGRVGNSGSGGNWQGITIRGNCIRGHIWGITGASNVWAEFSGNLVNNPFNTASIMANGDTFATNAWNYYHLHNTSGLMANIRGINPDTARNCTIAGWIIEPGNTDAAGDLMVMGGTGKTHAISRILLLPSPVSGNICGKLTSNISSGTFSYTLEHCTIPSSGNGETGLVQWGETWKGAVGTCTSCRSNLVYTPPGKAAGVKVQKLATTSGAPGTVQINNGETAVTGTSTTFLTTFVVGDWIRFGSEATAYQIAGIADDTHLTLASAYGGSSGSGKSYQAYVKDFIFHSAYNAANYNAGWGLAAGTDGKGYNCELSGSTGFTYTPGPNDITLTADPFVDSGRNMASWAVARGLAASGDSYNTKTDAAYAYIRAGASSGNVGTRIADLVEWVKAGWQVTSATLNNAGHDGLTIGALPFAGSGSTSLAPLLILTGGRAA